MRSISLRCAKSDFLGAARLVTTISKSRRRRSCETSASSPTVSISQFCSGGASHNHDSYLVSSLMTNILGMSPSQQTSVIQIFPYALLDYRLETGRHVFVPGGAGQEILVSGGRQFVNRYPYPQCDTVTRVVIHPEAVRQREVAGPHHFRNLDCHLRAAAASDSPRAGVGRQPRAVGVLWGGAQPSGASLSGPVGMAGHCARGVGARLRRGRNGR